MVSFLIMNVKFILGKKIACQENRMMSDFVVWHIF